MVMYTHARTHTYTHTHTHGRSDWQGHRLLMMTTLGCMCVARKLWWSMCRVSENIIYRHRHTHTCMHTQTCMYVYVCVLLVLMMYACGCMRLIFLAAGHAQRHEEESDPRGVCIWHSDSRDMYLAEAQCGHPRVHLHKETFLY